MIRPQSVVQCVLWHQLEPNIVWKLTGNAGNMQLRIIRIRCFKRKKNFWYTSQSMVVGESITPSPLPSPHFCSAFSPMLGGEVELRRPTTRPVSICNADGNRSRTWITWGHNLFWSDEQHVVMIVRLGVRSCSVLNTPSVSTGGQNQKKSVHCNFRPFRSSMASFGLPYLILVPG